MAKSQPEPRRHVKRDGPHSVDAHVGLRVRLRRVELGLSQTQLGDGIGLTFQQVQKYERGANRLAASRLADIARVLHVPVSFFFEELPGQDTVALVTSPATDRGTFEAMQLYSAIVDLEIRTALRRLMRIMVEKGV